MILVLLPLLLGLVAGSPMHSLSVPHLAAVPSLYHTNYGFHWYLPTFLLRASSHESRRLFTGAGREDSLWMCLVCGFVGCGRYGSAHGLEHHKLTGHNYAIEQQTQRVWDYTGDCYVHRLIQNRVDGKMIEVGDPNEAEQSGKLGQAMAKSMHSELIKEYETLLTQTLDTQRHYYDGQIAVLGAELERTRRRLELVTTSVLRELRLFPTRTGSWHYPLIFSYVHVARIYA